MKKHNPRPVSNLDLKLLDVKFIAIDDNQIYLTEALQSVRRAKLIELPSLLMSKTKSFETTHYDNTLLPEESFLNKADLKNRSTLESINQFDQSILSSKFRPSEVSYAADYTSNTRHSSQPKSLFSKHFEEQHKENEIQTIKEEIRTKNLLKNQSYQSLNPKSLPSFSKETLQSTTAEQLELQKYRRRIELIKRENLLIHKQISSLYKNKISQNKEPLKKIKRIEPFRTQTTQSEAEATRQFANRLSSNFNSHHPGDTTIIANMKRTLQMPRLSPPPIIPTKQASPPSPLILKKLHFYQNLSQKSPYKEELENIHKKIISNNLHKNFEQYLVAVNKRVPQFIKKLRN